MSLNFFSSGIIFRLLASQDMLHLLHVHMMISKEA
jgi:hypothetical protein